MAEADIVRRGLLDMQVCVPRSWSNEQVEQFANHNNPTGVEQRWAIREQGSEFLAGANERVQCEDHCAHVHIMLDI